MSWNIFTYDISLLEENPMQQLSKALSPQWTKKPRLLTVVDMYATDDLRQLLW